MGYEKQKKEQLRQFGIDKLKKIAISGYKKEKEQKIYKQLFATEYWKQAKVIGLTLSNEFEIDTRPLIEQASTTGKIVVIPKTLPKRQMAFYEFSENTVLKRSSFGVLEPVSAHLYESQMIDLLIVPGIIFHPDGYRIGFGGGYYDRYLEEYPHQTCSLTFKEMIHNDWEPEVFDKKIQHLLSD
ncbi:5-formyltetrahydrofolate cyclo-ligase [Enterococcus mundtii]|uniref:5-formyltetrahydrofolate cyclo-ligase n=1 Tax=Enterococcus mundtii TaxID=53346 RepID=UPI0002F07D1A|nr:5-formyltetrahydrofolate cyclo-ligase [Enterococcus mundtii]PTO36647.1 5-formyltetrahydrofolate cyclo-ligase [Enterococcus mundtii]PTO42377.1 5-formyltetrahydrofolate cyclo-ligase [Enterococcus mundtii]